ncbi:hypothetical protein TRIP_C20511 [Candidatus Zixiibacteriota bacterium]|nr:hypothetical protein TRIP_C20511 [candidate division Zixibacteria bacterium]
MNSILRPLFKILMAIALLISSHILPAVCSARTLTGYIFDTSDRPLFGATIFAFSRGKIITGTASDSTGRFQLKLPDTLKTRVVLQISSIGYEKTETIVDPSETDPAVNLILETKPIPIGRRVVSPARPDITESKFITRQIIEQRSALSFVPSDPISAVKGPQVIRAGSNYSAKIRINGTSPDYYLNNFLIGHDPSHYGMFAILPSSAVNDIKVTEQGTNAAFGTPGAVIMTSCAPFDSSMHGELNLSLVEATGTASLGNKKYFVNSSVRKSVLDKLVRHFDIHSDRRTIPPTNFQDIFLSSGLKLNAAAKFFIDQYYVRDYLSYRTSSTSANQNGINAVHHTDTKFIGLRLESLTSHFLIKAGAARRQDFEEYSASSANLTAQENLLVNLSARQSAYIGNAEINYLYRQDVFTIGGNLNKTSPRSIRPNQNNWNFLPPDATSDNPYIYQESLNRRYGRFQINDRETDAAVYLCCLQAIGPWKLENGVRLQYFGRLLRKSELASRHSLHRGIGRQSQISFFYGTFFENPAGRILEQYQSLIYLHLGSLRAIRTHLYSASFSRGAWRIGAFYKNTDRLPQLTPVFGNADFDPEVTIESGGRARFYGAELVFNKADLLSGLFDLYAYFGHTRAEKIVDNIVVPHELNARNRLYLETACHLRRTTTIGGELSIRSGNCYTPRRETDNIQSNYSSSYYYSQIKNENSARFPANITFNLFYMIRLAHFDLHLSLANVTNHSNAIVSTTDGYIYDTGLMPSFGLKYHF